MGLLITECLGCEVSNFRATRGKKRGSELPLQSVQWLGLPDSNAGGAFNLRLGTKIPHAGWHCQKKGRLNLISISQISLKFKENDY